jgi:hypothetical protein
MAVPLDKQQKHKISPVECQQKQSAVKRAGCENVFEILRDPAFDPWPPAPIPVDGHSQGMAAYACHERYNPRSSDGNTLQGATQR